MRDVELYQQLLGVVSPWTVNRVELSVEGERRCLGGARAGVALALPGVRDPVVAL